MVAIDGTTTAARVATPPESDGSLLQPAVQDIEAARLVAGLAGEPWGQLSPSTYETARLVSLAPWLAGHGARIGYLLDTQHPDGGWGGPDGYGLVPTLSATEALLTAVRQDADTAEHGAALAGAARRGLGRLFGWLAQPSTHPVPDTPAIELIVPALVEAINSHLDRLDDDPIPGLDRWRGTGRLGLPAGLDASTLQRIRSRLAGVAEIPPKLLHSLEILGDPAHAAGAVAPVAVGAVGASPAATAAWLASGPANATPARRYLETVVARHNGPVSSVIPVTAFERAWVLSSLLGVGYRVDLPADLMTACTATPGAAGTSGGAGLPPDADTTSVTLLTAALLGRPPGMDSLRPFDTGREFCTWPGERTPSTTTNAHVLEAFGHHVRVTGGGAADPEVVVRLSGWLTEQQLPDGSWVDKWHASPYYATVCCTLALHRYGGGPAGAPTARKPTTRTSAAAAVRRAVRWVLATQRVDGSWGRWQGTAEETAYAVQVLLSVAPESVRNARAAARGLAYLSAVDGVAADPPLWHDKDLYTPTAIVRAAVLAAVRLGRGVGVPVTRATTRSPRED